MTHAECIAALNPLDRRIYLLALVSQIADTCLTRCNKKSVTAVAWALDATRRWCLGLADREEVEAAAYVAYTDAIADADAADADAVAATAAAAYAAARAAYAAYAADAAAHAADAAAHAAYAADAADYAASRQRLVDSVYGVVWGHPTTSGYVVSSTHVWVPRDVAWGRWVPRLELTPEDAVLADVALEAA